MLVQRHRVGSSKMLEEKLGPTNPTKIVPHHPIGCSNGSNHGLVHVHPTLIIDDVEPTRWIRLKRTLINMCN